jgi:cytoskeletal protein CcmA (bactofilin family)
MSRKESTSVNPSTYITQIRHGSVISGNMKSEHSIRVDGYVTGDLVSGERIIIGEHGEIGGNLSGTDITIDGYVNGDVIANGLLHISKSAKIFGKIYAKRISVENGAEMNGKVNVGENAEIPELNTSSPSRSTKTPVLTTAKGQDKSDNYGNVAW